jgi:hypothetical protein
MKKRSVRVASGAYLDTCVISAYVKNELQPDEKRSFEEIVSAYQTEKIDLVRSAVVDQEIAAIPECHRKPHEELLTTLMSVAVPSIGGVTRPSPSGLPMANPARLLWRRLVAVLPDENDRSHIFIASRSRLRFFITVDRRTILSRKPQILGASGVEPVTPSEFVAHKQGPMRRAQQN